MADQVLVVEQGERGLKEKEIMLLSSIIGEEIKAVRDKAILLHKKRLDETEIKFKQLSDKKVEKYESEKHSLMKKVEKCETENSLLKKALGAARVRLLDLAAREGDVLALKEKLKENEDGVLALEEKLKGAENRIHFLQEQKKSREDLCHQENKEHELLTTSSLSSGNESETSQLILQNTKEPEVDSSTSTHLENAGIGSTKVDTDGHQEVVSTTAPSIGSRTRGSKRQASVTNGNVKKKAARKSQKSQNDLTEAVMESLATEKTIDELESKLMNQNTSMSKSLSKTMSKTMSREGQQTCIGNGGINRKPVQMECDVDRSQGYMEQTVSNILQAYQHVLTKQSK